MLCHAMEELSSIKTGELIASDIDSLIVIEPCFASVRSTLCANIVGRGKFIFNTRSFNTGRSKGIIDCSLGVLVFDA